MGPPGNRRPPPPGAATDLQGGGTCLRKCYFPDYRFSEDLDFTATQWFGWEELEEAVTEA